MYKTILVCGTEPGSNGPGSSHCCKLTEAIEKINDENGTITYIHTTELPKYSSVTNNPIYTEVKLRTVIIYTPLSD